MTAVPATDAMSAYCHRCDHPENSRLGKRRDAGVVIAERLAQNFPRMLAQQGGGYGVDCRRQAEMNRRFDIGDVARSRVRNLAEAMAQAYFRSIEGLLDGPKIADGDIGRLHPGHPVFASILHKNAGKNRAQFLFVSTSQTAIAEVTAGQIGSAEHFHDEATV